MKKKHSRNWTILCLFVFASFYLEAETILVYPWKEVLKPELTPPRAVFLEKVAEGLTEALFEAGHIAFGVGLLSVGTESEARQKARRAAESGGAEFIVCLEIDYDRTVSGKPPVLLSVACAFFSLSGSGSGSLFTVYAGDLPAEQMQRNYPEIGLAVGARIAERIIACLPGGF